MTAVLRTDIGRVRRQNEDAAWMDESKKAHKIRENRNLVHAKLCLKECREINEELCREVIGYLEEIVQSRFGTANS